MPGAAFRKPLIHGKKDLTPIVAGLRANRTYGVRSYLGS